MLLSQLVQIAMLAALVSAGLCALIIYSQKWHGKLSCDHDLDGVQKVHVTAVPRIGGVAVVAGVLLGLVLFVMLYPAAIKGTRITKIMMLIAASMPAFLAGITEDFTKRVSVRVRLAATVASALLASALLGATVTDLDIWGIDSLLTLAPVALVFTAIAVAGGSNAINIIDGFNGLSASVIIIMSAALGALGWQAGDMLVATLGALGVGATLGFMALNYPSGRLFLGDGGAYFLGFWVAEIAVLLLVRNPSINAWQVLSVCAYPVIEVLFSIYRRKFVKNVNAGAPDALHLHTLLYRRVVTRFVRHDPARPWKRNAAVAFLTAPVLGAVAVVTVLAGSTIAAAAAIVAGQLLIYLAVYGRLVRGRWIARPVKGIRPQVPANPEISS